MNPKKMSRVLNRFYLKFLKKYQTDSFTVPSPILFVDIDYLQSIAKTTISQHDLKCLVGLLQSSIFTKVQEEALKSPKSLLNLLGFLKQFYPNLFLIFKHEPLLLKTVLKGQLFRSFDDFDDDEYSDNQVGLLDEQDQFAIETVP